MSNELKLNEIREFVLSEIETSRKVIAHCQRKKLEAKDFVTLDFEDKNISIQETILSTLTRVLKEIDKQWMELPKVDIK